MYQSTNLRDTTTPNTKQFSGMIAGAQSASQWPKPTYHVAYNNPNQSYAPRTTVTHCDSQRSIGHIHNTESSMALALAILILSSNSLSLFKPIGSFI